MRSGAKVFLGPLFYFETCWAHWFPDSARELALKDVEFIFYLAAIGSESLYPEWA